MANTYLLEDSGTEHAVETPQAPNAAPEGGSAGAVPEATGGAPTPKSTASAEGSGAGEAVGSPAQGTETITPPKIMLGEREVPLDVAQKAVQDYENDQKWREKNRRESEELNRRAEELREAEILKSLLERRPDLRTQLLSPVPTRDFNKELESLYAQMPEPYDTEAIRTWSMKRDQLILEKQTADAQAITEAKALEAENIRYHNDIDEKAKQKYVDKGILSMDEFKQLRKFIIENAKVDQRGRVSQDVFDHAYKIVFSEKYEEGIRLAAAKAAVAPMAAASRATGSGGGVTQRTPPPTPEDEDNSAFINRVKQVSRGKWTELS